VSGRPPEAPEGRGGRPATVAMKSIYQNFSVIEKLSLAVLAVSLILAIVLFGGFGLALIANASTSVDYYPPENFIITSTNHFHYHFCGNDVYPNCNVTGGNFNYSDLPYQPACAGGNLQCAYDQTGDKELILNDQNDLSAPYDLISFYYDNSTHQISNLAVNGVPAGGIQGIASVISLFVVSTTTSQVHIRGIWTASSSPTNSQELRFYQTSPMAGQESLVSLVATTSGIFDFTLPWRSDYILHVSSTTGYFLTPPVSLFGELYQRSDQWASEGIPLAYTLLDATSTQISVASLASLDVASTSYYSSTFGTSSLPDTGDLLSFLNVPNLLATKVPFAYVFQISQAIYGAANSPAADIPLGTISIPFPVANQGTTTLTLDLFSTSTIGRFLDSGHIVFLRGFMALITYAETGFVLFLLAKHRRNL